jgi:2,3-dihydro-2,3-dihydroxybenzoate dehydrogenase
MIALVTGAAQGIGAAVVRRLCRDGLTVIPTDRRASRVRSVGSAPVSSDAGAGPSATAPDWAELDVRDTEAVERVVGEVEARVGPIEVLVNVAGVLHCGAAVETTDAEWSEVFDVNATGVFRLSRAVGAAMARRGSGSIVTVASNAAGVPRMNMAAYAASKAAAAHFTRCLGLELARFGVRCNIVSPGSTDTPMQRGLWTGDDGARTAVLGAPEQFKVGIPLGRIADPDDVAEAVAFLASDRARHITMHDLYVDGGAALHV